MQSKEYTSAAIKTESVPDRLVMNQTALHAAFLIATAAAGVLNQVKRKLYYGKPLVSENVDPHLQRLIAMANYFGALTQNVPEGEGPESSEVNFPLSQETIDSFNMDPAIAGMKLENLNVRLLHGAIGMFTETGEMLEALLKQYEGGTLDVVNFGEEIGDTEWYKAIILDETGLDEGVIRTKNIAKLAKRYPEKFCADAAVNRDVAAERKVLEAPVAFTGVAA